jgi:hypothetical protein
LKELFPLWPGNPPNSYLPEPDAVMVNVRYPLPNGRGYVSVQLLPAARQPDGQAIFQLTLTAKGPPASQSTAGILEWFDFSRPYVNDVFFGVTSERLHEIWTRRANK